MIMKFTYNILLAKKVNIDLVLEKENNIFTQMLLILIMNILTYISFFGDGIYLFLLHALGKIGFLNF